ncbi:MAG: LysM peptidoglycan-binding domain-containing protein, partial [Hamadaea sp.]|nr:LysM peptidoglycan-binding domain-containing protein [Hamadaea sp.]
MRVMRRLAAGCAALAGLAALVVGAPVVLLEVGGNPLPSAWPTVGQIVDGLTGPDDGGLALRALASAGWIAWATFVVSVLWEIPARTRGRRAARLPGLRLQQRVAAALVGAIVAVFVGGTVASASIAVARPPAVVATATVPDSVSGPALTSFGPSGPIATSPAVTGVTATSPIATTVTGAGATARTAAQVTIQRPVYVVKRGDYLGVIAQRFTGDFDRYHQIAALNPKLIRNPDHIRPGWRLTLPVDAHDHGKRHHATGRLVVPVAKPVPPATPTPAPPAQPGVTRPEASPAASTPAARTPEKEEISVVLTVAAALTAAGVLTGHAVLWRRRLVRVHQHYLGRRRVTAVRYPVTPVNPVWTPAEPAPEPVAVVVAEPPRWPDHTAAERLDASLRRLALGLRG